MNFRKIALLLAVLMLVGTIAACGSSSPTPTPGPAASTTGGSKLIPEPITIDVWYGDQAQNPYNPDWLVRELIAERTNITYNCTALMTGMTDKLNLAVASRDLPDMIPLGYPDNAADWGTRQGAVVNFANHFDEMPNFMKWSRSQGKYVDDYFTSVDGGLYMMPVSNMGITDHVVWMYRKDIFDMHGLVPPTNENEMFDVCYELKQLYPDSYPLMNRGYVDLYGRVAHHFGTGNFQYWNASQKKWVYGQTEANFQYSVEWSAKLYSNGILPLNVVTMDVPTWDSYVLTNRGFVLNQYQVQLDTLYSRMKEENPNVEWAYMKPWKGGPNGRTDNQPTPVYQMGYMLFSTSKYQSEIIKLFDWFYTDEGIEVMNWGKEDESYYYNLNGTKAHIGITPGESASFDVINLYGFYARGFYCVFDTEARLTYASQESRRTMRQIVADAAPAESTKPGVSFSSDRIERINILRPILQNHSLENVGLFITGQRPLAEYDDFVSELYALGLDEFLQLYNDQQTENDANK